MTTEKASGKIKTTKLNKTYMFNMFYGNGGRHVQAKGAKEQVGKAANAAMLQRRKTKVGNVQKMLGR